MLITALFPRLHKLSAAYNVSQLLLFFFTWSLFFSFIKVKFNLRFVTGSKVKKAERTPPPNPETRPPKATMRPPEKGCTNRIQAAILGKDKKTYVINRDKVYVLGLNLGIDQGPLPLENYFKGLKFVDAAFRRQIDQKTVLFNKDK